jgi:hypothetical protein
VVEGGGEGEKEREDRLFEDPDEGWELEYRRNRKFIFHYN